MNEGRIIALLGRRDAPTDAVEEYCGYLRDALLRHGLAMELARVTWAEQGWPVALSELQQKAQGWQDRWVLVQYTALAWSARGFPLRIRGVIEQLRKAGARIALVYHDVEPYGGSRLIDKLRHHAQLRVMRQTLNAADLGVFTVPVEVISWLGHHPENAAFIPVGANLSITSSAVANPPRVRPGPLGVAVFGITEGATGRAECERIVDLVSFAATHGVRLRLHAFGRGARESEKQLRDALRGLPVEVRVDGILPVRQVVEAFSCSDVALFVRAPISSRRSSAIAALSCGLPMVAYAGPETTPPITEAGVVLTSQDKKAEMRQALLRVLGDADFRASLAERSRRAHTEYFSWEAIAARYVEALGERG